MSKHTPGPWIWKRQRSTGSGEWLCTLVSTANPNECPAHDTMIIPMREDCAQFPYAGTLPNHLLLQASPDLLEASLPVLREAKDRADYLAHNWNEEAHIEITLTIAEIRAIHAAISKALGEQP